MRIAAILVPESRSDHVDVGEKMNSCKFPHMDIFLISDNKRKTKTITRQICSRTINIIRVLLEWMGIMKC